VLDSGASIIRPQIVGIMQLLGPGPFANNAAAVAGGLSPGDVYHVGGDPSYLAIVF
jgi:hypothetical protein